MRVLKIFDGDYPWDVRVEKVTRALHAAGHEVLVVCRNKAGHPRSEILEDGVAVERLPATTGRWNFLSFPFFFNPLWIVTVVRATRRFAPDLVLARDLPIAPLGILAGRIAKAPVVADLAEPYPDSLRTNLQLANPSRLDYLVRNPDLADLVERFVVRNVAASIVVCPEAGWRLERQGLAAEAWSEVRNTAILSRFSPTGETPEAIRRFAGRTVVLFSGLISHDRGLEVAIDAMAKLRERSPGRFALLVVGEGPMRAELAERVRALRLEDDVHLAGWMDYGKLPDVVLHSDMGILPFHDCDHIRASLANKLFEYMALGLPIIASDIPVQTRIVEDVGSGLVFPPNDAEALAEAIERLGEDDALRKRCGEAGRAASRTLYHWGVDGARLVSALEHVLQSGRDARGLPAALRGPAPLLAETGREPAR
ncbi:MAG: glycosyltransferase family 4 protein [Myxococcota bacterium]